MHSQGDGHVLLVACSERGQLVPAWTFRHVVISLISWLRVVTDRVMPVEVV
jgi:hypothetical protein